MAKKVLVLTIAAVMMFVVFGSSACNLGRGTLDGYKSDKIAELQDYVLAKGEDNYSAENWTIICGMVTDGKIAINKADSKDVIDTAYKTATDAVDSVVEENEMSDYEFTLKTDKTIAMVGDKITATLQLKNLSDDDVLIEIPDWIAAEGGHELKDILVSYCFPFNSGFKWEVESIAVEPRPRIVFGKNGLIERTFEFTVSEAIDIEIFAGAFFYIDGTGNGQFSKQITLTKNSIKIQIEG